MHQQQLHELYCLANSQHKERRRQFEPLGTEQQK